MEEGGRENNDDWRTRSDGVHRLGKEDPFGRRAMVPGGELADPKDPESILMAKQEEEARQAEKLGMTLDEYRKQKKVQQRFDKAA